MRYLNIEIGMGVALNLVTTIIMCWLAWALLKPQGIVPQGWEIAVVQSTFFEVNWGAVGKIVFLIVAAAFLCDAWLQTADGVSRMQADYLYTNVASARRFDFRTLYYIFVGVFTLLTTVTLPLAEPGQLLILRGVIAFMAMGIICPGLVYLNYVRMPRIFPSWVMPHAVTRVIMILIAFVYISVGVWYIFVRLSG